MSGINWKDKCWVVTVYLVADGRVLLSWNNRVNMWVPVGGHIDPGETPVEAVRREVAEETGFEFEFLDKELEVSHRLLKINQPHHIQVEKVPHHGEHINFVYFARCTKHAPLTENDEGDKLRWFAREELNDMPDEIRESALAALECAGKNSQ